MKKTSITLAFLMLLCVFSAQAQLSFVLDIGSDFISVGFKGADKPTLRFPSVIGSPRYGYSQTLPGEVHKKENHIGWDAIWADSICNKMGLVVMRYPTKQGYDPGKLLLDIELLVGYALNLPVFTDPIEDKADAIVIVTGSFGADPSIRDMVKNSVFYSTYQWYNVKMVGFVANPTSTWNGEMIKDTDIVWTTE